ncbi:hypothetical protein FDP41_001397 [Naegleria fowleri]|uniref:Serine aminopeptidase S33 domain-containing protein n=1 Tax=Naegleria fowleri TaxID=5763 RepID=A0A6A5C369_NAEFO|nr:uncharacterized protein FDP41_001397 [Naegleria fowleri]KAF0979729.1 hypothetical protein FDP41_001397 [Naegleria fowleri]
MAKTNSSSLKEQEIELKDLKAEAQDSKHNTQLRDSEQASSSPAKQESGWQKNIPSLDTTTKRQKKWPCSRIMKCCLIGIVVGLVLLLAIVIGVFIIAWFSAGAFLYDFAFRVDPLVDCDATMRTNRPWNYTADEMISTCTGNNFTIFNASERFGPYYINSSAQYETVTFKSRDPEWISQGGGKIRGTLVLQPVVNETSRFVIIVHGIRACRFTYASVEPASMLYQMGYNVFMIDLRNHGDSDSYRANPYGSFGLYEHRDVLGALDYLTERFAFLNTSTPNVSLFGSSMGGSTVLVSFQVEKRFRAVFTDSAACNVYQTIFTNAVEIVSSEALAKIAFATAMSVVNVKGKMGFPPFSLDPQTLMGSVDLSGPRKMFLFQTSNDFIVPDFNLQLCVTAAKASATQQGLNPDQKVQSYLDTVQYPPHVKLSRLNCANHLVSIYFSCSGENVWYANQQQLPKETILAFRSNSISILSAYKELNESRKRLLDQRYNTELINEVLENARKKGTGFILQDVSEKVKEALTESVELIAQNIAILKKHNIALTEQNGALKELAKPLAESVSQLETLPNMR